MIKIHCIKTGKSITLCDYDTEPLYCPFCKGEIGEKSVPLKGQVPLRGQVGSDKNE